MHINTNAFYASVALHLDPELRGRAVAVAGDPERSYLDIDESGADLLFQPVSARYERRSTVITTNVGIGGWAKVFGDEVAASAIADRACRHCHVIKITDRSYRLKDLPAGERRKEGWPILAEARWCIRQKYVGATGRGKLVQWDCGGKYIDVNNGPDG